MAWTAAGRAAEFRTWQDRVNAAHRVERARRGRTLTFAETAAVVAAVREARSDRWRDTAARDARRAVAWAWHRIDPDGWCRPSYAWWLARQVAAGWLPARGAWRSWINNPGQARYARRRLDAVRRVSRLDSATARTARLYGWWAAHPWRVVTDRDVDTSAAAPHARPRWITRRWRVARSIVRGVACGTVRGAAVADAWIVANAAADGVDTVPRTYGGHGRAVPDLQRWRTDDGGTER